MKKQNVIAAVPAFIAEKIELWPVDRLIPNPRNARIHPDAQIRQIADSIATVGFIRPIVADSTGLMFAGHGTLDAAKLLGLEQVPVILVDQLTDAQKRVFMLADNRLTELADWDYDAVRREIESLAGEGFDWTATGFDDHDLAEWQANLDPLEGQTDEDAVPELKEKPISVLGDCWCLGDHRLLVGDATDEAAVDALMDGEQADLVITDLPYNVNYQGYTAKQLKIEGDNLAPEAFKVFLERAFRSYRRIVKNCASVYAFHASSCQREFQDALEHAGFEVRCQLIWAKNTFAWGFGRYKFGHEPLFFAHVKGEVDEWYGDKTQSTLWQENKPAANRIHPTAKPVELAERALLNSAKIGDIVVDLFAGSGSVLIACERRNRKSRSMEIDPKYADCIIRRWQAYTGRQAFLDVDRGSFAEVERTRNA